MASSSGSSWKDLGQKLFAQDEAKSVPSEEDALLHYNDLARGQASLAGEQAEDVDATDQGFKIWFGKMRLQLTSHQGATANTSKGVCTNLTTDVFSVLLNLIPTHTTTLPPSHSPTMTAAASSYWRMPWREAAPTLDAMVEKAQKEQRRPSAPARTKKVLARSPSVPPRAPPRAPHRRQKCSSCFCWTLRASILELCGIIVIIKLRSSRSSRRSALRHPGRPWGRLLLPLRAVQPILNSLRRFAQCHFLLSC